MKHRDGSAMVRFGFIRASVALVTGLCIISILLLPAGALARDIRVGIIDCYSGPPAV